MPDCAPGPAPAAALAAKVAFLREPSHYTGSVTAVDAIETHMSWVFLADGHAWKLKKPFRRGRLDYTDIAARRRSCCRELRLNRRLAPDVYLDVQALTADAHGRLAIGGAGKPVDWLLRMRRLPAERSFEALLRTQRAGAADVRRIVARLLAFFAVARRIRIGTRHYRHRLLHTVGEACADLQRFDFRPQPPVAALAERLRAQLQRLQPQLDARVQDGRIIDGHGDLRPEHIYLTDPPTIVDCIEFDRALRQRDPVDELAFLAVECDRLGRSEVDRWLFDAYAELGDDRPPRLLIDGYKACHALNRARITILHLDDPDTGPPARWAAKTTHYLEQLGRYLDAVERGVATALPGSALSA